MTGFCTLKQMLPYLAASIHNLYTKSVFLNDMQDLPLKHPEVYQQFLDGKHVFRRSNRQWARISPDLAIEQRCMHNLKTSGGGLTRGSGMTENQHNIGFYHDLH